MEAQPVQPEKSEQPKASGCCVFAVAGHPIVENCLAGYNSSIFAYGQTGAGKTYTMIGQLGKSDQVRLLCLTPSQLHAYILFQQPVCVQTTDELSLSR